MKILKDIRKSFTKQKVEKDIYKTSSTSFRLFLLTLVFAVLTALTWFAFSCETLASCVVGTILSMYLIGLCPLFIIIIADIFD